MRLTKWVKIDQIIENYKKDYPREWKSFCREMDKMRKDKVEKRQKGKMQLSAKFPAYPDHTDISAKIMKVIPDFIINDYKWKRFKKTYPEFFR
jgi:hypothetical protein